MNGSILTYEQIDRTEWEELVKASATGTWFQTPKAYDFFASMPDLFAPFVIGYKPTSGSSLKGREGETARCQSISSFAKVWGVHTADSSQYNLLKENAQKNRRNLTEAESVLWDLLKGNNIGMHFRRQHIILDYIVDFVCIEKGLVIELDGGYHNSKEQKHYDENRTAHLNHLGYTELRFTNEELLHNPDEVIDKILSTASSLPSIREGVGRKSSPPCREGLGEGILRAICVGYVTVEKNPVKQFFTRRAIIIGGPCIADDATDEEVEALLCALKNSLLLGKAGVGSRPIYIETRNFNDYSRWKGAFEKAGFAYQPHLNFHVDCTDKEKMWERLSDNRKRQLRKQLNPSPFLQGKDVSESDVREWYGILTQLYRTKVKTPLFPLSFFMEAYRQNIGKFLLVKHEGKVIGGSFCVELKKIPITNHQLPINTYGAVYEWFECGKNAEYKEQYPSVAATYMGMEYAALHGFARYDMMGAGVPNKPYGVRDFKTEFGGELVEQGRFLCIMRPILYKIGLIGVKVLKRGR